MHRQNLTFKKFITAFYCLYVQNLNIFNTKHFDLKHISLIKHIFALDLTLFIFLQYCNHIVHISEKTVTNIAHISAILYSHCSYFYTGYYTHIVHISALDTILTLFIFLHWILYSHCSYFYTGYCTHNVHISAVQILYSHCSYFYSRHFTHIVHIISAMDTFFPLFIFLHWILFTLFISLHWVPKSLYGVYIVCNDLRKKARSEIAKMYKKRNFHCAGYCKSHKMVGNV